MTFQAVIFDLDGTLIASEALALQTGQQVFAAHGHSLPEALFRRLIGQDFTAAREVLRQSLPADLPFDLLDQEWREAMQHRVETEGLPLRPGALELIQHLASQALPLAIATSSQRISAERKLRLTGLAPYFQTVITREDVQNPKPAPEAYLMAASRLGYNAPSCLAFEDSDTGTQAARLAGMTVIQVPDLAPTQGLHAHHLAPSLIEGARRVGLWT